MLKNPKQINDEFAQKVERQISFDKLDDMNEQSIQTNNNNRRHRKHNSIFSVSNSQQKLLQNNDTSKATTNHQNFIFDDASDNTVHIKEVSKIMGTSLQRKTYGSTMYQDPANRTNQGLRFRNSHKDRITEAVRRNSILDCSPSKIHEGSTYEKIMNLRPRQADKEVGGQMRYQAKSNAEKIIDKYHKHNPLFSVENKRALAPHLTTSQGYIKKNIDFIQRKRNHQQSESAESSQKGKKMISLKPQYLFPQLHDKTMFKAAIEYTLGQETSTRSLHDQSHIIHKKVASTAISIQDTEPDILNQSSMSKPIPVKRSTRGSFNPSKQSKTPGPNQRRLANNLNNLNNSLATIDQHVYANRNALRILDNSLQVENVESRHGLQTMGSARKMATKAMTDTSGFPATAESKLRSTIDPRQDLNEVDSRSVTQDVLRRCKIYRTKNAAVQPVRAGQGQTRLYHSREENRQIRNLLDKSSIAGPSHYFNNASIEAKRGMLKTQY